MYQGLWVEVVEMTDKLLERKDTGRIARIGALLALAYVRVRQGDATAISLLDDALDWSEFAGARRMESPWALRAEAAWLSGNNHLALAESQKAYDIAMNKQHPWMTGELAFWRWRAGEKSTPPTWIAKPFALQIAGDWRGAAKEWEERGCPYEQGMALMDGDESAQLAALEIFGRLGARQIIEILKRQMRTQGIRIPRGPRPATRENPFGLTSRETEVLGCLVEGQSNNAIAKKLNLSTRTVEHHIASILQKMGVGSRNEAVALAVKENLLFSE
jgi:DNA-binding CsgD family transcriptional regulator